MTKKISFIFLTIIVLLGYIFNIDKDISTKLNHISISIKSTYNRYLISIINTFYTFYNQKETITKLQDEISINNNFKTLYNISSQELAFLKKELIDTNISVDATYVEVLSYLKLNNFTEVILDIELNSNEKIYSLLTNQNFSAGIVLSQNNQTIGYLNQNPKCNYAVFIGKNNAPGITAGANEKGEITIKHIPKWHSINIDDKVITSGMDNIFPKGIKVGVVTSIKELSNTKIATIKTYAKVLTKKSFYLIDKKSNK